MNYHLSIYGKISKEEFDIFMEVGTCLKNKKQIQLNLFTCCVYIDQFNIYFWDLKGIIPDGQQ